MRLAVPPAFRASAAVIAVPVVLLGMLWGGREACSRSDFFRIRQVEVTGVRYLAVDDVVDALGLREDASICDALEDAAQSVRALAGVADAAVGRRIPGSIRVNVQEVTPVAFVPVDDGLVVVDAFGEPLPFDPVGTRLDLPIVARTSPVLLALLARLQRAEPAFADRVTSAKEDRGRLMLELDSIRVLFAADASATAVRAVTAVSAGLAARGVMAVDLDARFTGQIVARPRVTQ